MKFTYLTRETLLGRLKVLDNDEAWEEFVFYYRRFIYSIIRKMNVPPNECEDLSQQVLVKLWKQLPNFDYNQKQGAFRAWLFVVTRNSVYDYFSKMKVKADRKEGAEVLFSKSMQEPDVEQAVEEEWKRHISVLAFENIAKKVSEKSMEIFKAAVNGESNQEIAERLEMNEETVCRYKNRVKEKFVAEIKNLRDMLE